MPEDEAPTEADVELAEPVDPSVDHYCGDHVGDAGACTVCGGPDPR